MELRPIAFRLAAICIAASLGGCLVSEESLLDSRNGRAKPLPPGLYEACEIEEDGEPDCKTMNVSRDASSRYAFTVAEEGENDEDVTFVRFRRIGSGAWVAQMHGDEEEEDFFYFLAETIGPDFVMALVVCEDIPGAVRRKYVARGAMEVDGDATVCTAKTLRAVIGATKAYRAAIPIEDRSRIVYRKLEG